MNSLNSVLIEGTFLENIKQEADELCARFIIEAIRKTESEREIHEEISCFEIVAYRQFAELCATLEKNQGIRIVGRLKQDGNHVVIIAEHIEFKPGKRI